MMRSKIYILLPLLCVAFNLFAQFTLRIQITKTPSAHKEDGVFVAGSFNGWNPGNNNYAFFNRNDSLMVEIKNLPANIYQFKFTRGSWQKVESTTAGKDVANKSVHLFSDTTIQYSIEGWRDDFVVEKEKAHTASASVKIIDTAFYMPQLNRHRRIWLYLPPNYQSSNKKYPVLYMHDGQNLFDEFASAFGEWDIDECMDSLLAKGKQASIIVGIDNGGTTRMSEYNPYEFTWKDSVTAKTFSAEGDAYVDFITQTLKPFIDKKYRTLSSKENTIIAGSSMGGLISYYAALKYPDVFGKAGVFSPAFWTAQALKEFTDSVSKKVSAKFFFYIGGQEGEQHIQLMNEIAEQLATNSNTMIYTVVDGAGKHNEAAWHKWFAEFYNWMMADGYNNIITLEE